MVFHFFLAIDDVVIAFSDRARAQRRQVRTRTRFRVSLAPPILGRQHARQEIILLRRIAEVLHHRREHFHGKYILHRRACRGALFVKNMLLHDVPPSSAELGRPTGRTPSLGVEDFLPAHHVVFGSATSQFNLGADVLGQLGREKCTHFVAKLFFFRRKF
jgi:hypothetical protein